jgi:hypothetical protein
MANERWMIDDGIVAAHVSHEFPSLSRASADLSLVYESLTVDRTVVRTFVNDNPRYARIRIVVFASAAARIFFPFLLQSVRLDDLVDPTRGRSGSRREIPLLNTERIQSIVVRRLARIKFRKLTPREVPVVPREMHSRRDVPVPSWKTVIR